MIMFITNLVGFVLFVVCTIRGPRDLTDQILSCRLN